MRSRDMSPAEQRVSASLARTRRARGSRSSSSVDPRVARGIPLPAAPHPHVGRTFGSSELRLPTTPESAVQSRASWHVGAVSEPAWHSLPAAQRAWPRPPRHRSSQAAACGLRTQEGLATSRLGGADGRRARAPRGGVCSGRRFKPRGVIPRGAPAPVPATGGGASRRNSLRERQRLRIKCAEAYTHVLRKCAVNLSEVANPGRGEMSSIPHSLEAACSGDVALVNCAG